MKNKIIIISLAITVVILLIGTIFIAHLIIKRNEVSDDLATLNDYIPTKFAKLEDLPQNYTKEQAIQDGCFVIDQVALYNKNKLDSFIKNTGTTTSTNSKKEDSLKIVQFTVEGDMIITEVSYKIREETYTLSGEQVNKTNYVVRVDNTRDKFSAEADRKITTNEDIPGEIYDIVESKNGDYIDVNLTLCAQINYVDANAKTYENILLCSYSNSAKIVEDYPSFIGTVTQFNKTNMFVEPDEGEEERKSSDTFSISLGENNDMIYTVGQKVKITYTGLIREIYPASIDVIKIELKSANSFEILINQSQRIVNGKEDIIKSSETNKYNYNIYAYNVAVDIRINGDDVIPLREALLKEKITMDEIIAKANEDFPNAPTYDDGGTIVYNYENYTITKYHTLDGNRDVCISQKTPAIYD